jgi:hypothetical protein
LFEFALRLPAAFQRHALNAPHTGAAGSAGRAAFAPLPALDPDEPVSDVPLASDYFEAIEDQNGRALPAVTWFIGDRGTDADLIPADEADPLGLGSHDEDVQEVLDVMRDTL